MNRLNRDAETLDELYSSAWSRQATARSRRPPTSWRIIPTPRRPSAGTSS